MEIFWGLKYEPVLHSASSNYEGVAPWSLNISLICFTARVVIHDAVVFIHLTKKYLDVGSSPALSNIQVNSLTTLVYVIIKTLTFALDSTSPSTSTGCSKFVTCMYGFIN